MILIVEFPTVQLLAFQIAIIEALVFVEDQLKFVTTLFVLNFKNRCNRKDRKILLFFLYKYLISNGIKLLASLYHICSLFFIKLQLYTCNFSNKVHFITHLKPHQKMATSSISLLAPQIFVGENYQIWSVKMQTYLEAFDLWEVVAEEEPIAPLSTNQSSY